MPAILIVDDDFIIRSTIEALLNQYQSENNIALDILQAQNGEEAVAMCADREIHLIFLDVLMPGLDGIETAKRIKKISPKSMIVAISSLADENKQIEMLRNGAEDYILKPIVYVLFTNRLRNYLRIIQSRDTIGFKYNAVNAFTSTIYNYKIEFGIASDEELAQFWETVLIHFEMQRLIPDISNAVSFFYRLGSIYLDLKYRFNIFIEEDKEFFYISINNIKLLTPSKIEKLIADHYSNARYTIKENIITFLLNKESYERVPLMTQPQDLSAEATGANRSEASSDTKESSVYEKAPQESAAETPKGAKDVPKKIEDLKIFHFLDPDDLDDLDAHLDKLHHLILRMKSQDLSVEDCQNIAQFFQSIAQTISLSNETYTLSTSLQRLASTLNSYQTVFIQQSKNLSEFVLAFVNDLIQWKNMVFYDGAPSISFMDASILANVEMITVLLVPQTHKEDDSVDDIFDF